MTTLISDSHPATKQDLWVTEKFGTDYTGTFLEIGGYDGVTHSNTTLLERLGWSGWLIEGCPDFFEQCKANRPKSWCLNAVLAPGFNIHERMVISEQWTGLASTLDPVVLAESRRRGAVEVELPTKRLVDVIRPRHIDYVSIDIEGGELEVMRHWFNAGGRCSALTVEFRYDGTYLSQLERMCADYDLHLDELRGFDACFAVKELL